MFNIRCEQALFYAARAHALSELFRDLEIQLRNEEDWYRAVDEEAKDNEPFHKQLGLIVAASRAVERAKGQTTMREDKAARMAFFEALELVAFERDLFYAARALACSRLGVEPRGSGAHRMSRRSEIAVPARKIVEGASDTDLRAIAGAPDCELPILADAAMRRFGIEHFGRAFRLGPRQWAAAVIAWSWRGAPSQGTRTKREQAVVTAALRDGAEVALVRLQKDARPGMHKWSVINDFVRRLGAGNVQPKTLQEEWRQRQQRQRSKSRIGVVGNEGGAQGRQQHATGSKQTRPA